MNISKKDFAPIIIVLITALLVAGLGGYIYFQSKDKPITRTTTIFDSAIITTTTTIVQFENTTTTTLVTTTDWSCGDSITFTYKGESVTYGTVESQGRCWLDRNLGALRVAEASNDFEAYGDLFQWGRGDDGHQDCDSDIVQTPSNLDEPGHSNFISNFIIGVDEYGTPIIADNPNWRNPPNDNLWQGEGGVNNPCPLGWHVPTKEEWENEISSWIDKNNTGAINSPLRLPNIRMVFGRCYAKSVLAQMVNYGAYWSQTVCDKNAYMFLFLSDRYESDCYARSWGFAVRCVKD